MEIPELTPPNESTAMSAVPPPKSATNFPSPESMSRPAPIADALGVSIKYTDRTP